MPDLLLDAHAPQGLQAPLKKNNFKLIKKKINC